MPLLRQAKAYRGQSTVARPRWFVAVSSEVKAMFGLRPEQKWPAAGLPARVIDGVTVMVRPLDPNRPRGRAGRKPHRVMATCAVCQKTVSLGRLGQHVAVHGW